MESISYTSIRASVSNEFARIKLGLNGRPRHQRRSENPGNELLTAGLGPWRKSPGGGWR